MGNYKILIYSLIALVMIQIASAATIYGNVYDFSLNKVNNARVEIDTSPKQFLIARNGSYSFNVPNGAYAIKAQLMQKNTAVASVQENITIKQDGSYVLDLILFPDVEEGVENPGIDVNGNVIDTSSPKNYYWILISLLLVIVLGAGLYYFKIKKKKSTGKLENDNQKPDVEEVEDLEQVIKIIKSEGGRATQKEIRKQIPLSEAKISLMIAELEHKGSVEKIKKGRGNIIILKKR